MESSITHSQHIARRELLFLNLILSENPEFARVTLEASRAITLADSQSEKPGIPECPNVSGLNIKLWNIYQEWVSEQFAPLIDKFRDETNEEEKSKYAFTLFFLRRKFPINLIFYAGMNATERQAIIRESLDHRNKLIRKGISALQDANQWIKKLNPVSEFDLRIVPEDILEQIQNSPDSEKEMDELIRSIGIYSPSELKALYWNEATLEYYEEELYLNKQVTHTRLFPLLLEPIFDAFDLQETGTTKANRSIALLLIDLDYEMKKIDTLTDTVRNWKNEIRGLRSSAGKKIILPRNMTP